MWIGSNRCSCYRTPANTTGCDRQTSFISNRTTTDGNAVVGRRNCSTGRGGKCRNTWYYHVPVGCSGGVGGISPDIIFLAYIQSCQCTCKYTGTCSIDAYGVRNIRHHIGCTPANTAGTNCCSTIVGNSPSTAHNARFSTRNGWSSGGKRWNIFTNEGYLVAINCPKGIGGIGTDIVVRSVYQSGKRAGKGTRTGTIRGMVSCD